MSVLLGLALVGGLVFLGWCNDRKACRDGQQLYHRFRGQLRRRP